MTPPAPAQPPKLKWLLRALLFGLVYNALNLLAIPFSGPTIQAVLAEAEERVGLTLPPLPANFIEIVLWLSFTMTALVVIWYNSTYQAVKEGRRWGYISSLLIGLSSLLYLFTFNPLAIILVVVGIFMLIACFDKDVKNYFKARQQSGEQVS